MDLLIYAVPFFIVAILLEAYWTRDRKYYRLNDTISNFSAGIFQQLIGALPLFLLFSSYSWIYQQFALFPQVFAKHVWWAWPLLFIAEDLKYYWFHRSSHRIALFWSGHVVHHQSEEYNFSVALRQSTLQDFFVIPWAWPFAVIGFDPIMYISMYLLVIAIQFWIHTRAIGKLPRFLEAWLNTPSHHRVHHARNDIYIDRNYGGVFIIWDKIFKTWIAESEQPVYGVTIATTSWNPLRAQFYSIKALWDSARGQGSWLHRAKVFFGPPGWTHDNPTGRSDYVAREKFDPELSRQQMKFALVLFSVILILSFIFLSLVHRLPAVIAIAIAIVLTLGLFFLGKILDPA